jgi:hypothetical protein
VVGKLLPAFTRISRGSPSIVRQPIADSRRIQQLEAALFKRHHCALALTDAGKVRS